MQAHRHELLTAVPGTTRHIHSFHYGPANAPSKVYIQASLHADELPGMLVLWHLKQRLAELEAARGVALAGGAGAGGQSAGVGAGADGRTAGAFR